VSEERLMVLTMLQEGKISSEEASKLLQALDGLEIEEELNNQNEDVSNLSEDNLLENQTSHDDERYTGFILKENQEDHGSADKFDKETKGFEDKTDDLGDKEKTWEKSFDEKSSDFGKDMGDFGKKMGAWGENFGEKMGNWGENFGERMGKVGEELAESATSITEKVLKMVDGFISDGSLVIFPGSYETVTETIERNISSLNSPIIEIHGLNGKIILHSGEDSNIHIQAKCSIKKSVYDKNLPVYEVIEDNNTLIFKPRYTNGIGTSLDVYIPSTSYDKIFLLTTNGRIEVYDANPKELILDTNNGSIKAQDICSSRLIACTNNGSINIEDIDSKEIELDTSNATINARNTSCENIIVTTRNGRINIIATQAKEMVLTSSNAAIKVEDSIASAITSKTSNGSIKIIDIETSNLHKIESYTSNSSIEMHIDAHNKAYNIDAQTSMGRIEVEIPNLIYDINKQSSPGKQKILAHSTYDTETDNQINIIASTSNGSIKIS